MRVYSVRTPACRTLHHERTAVWNCLELFETRLDAPAGYLSLKKAWNCLILAWNCLELFETRLELGRNCLRLAWNCLELLETRLELVWNFLNLAWNSLGTA